MRFLVACAASLAVLVTAVAAHEFKAGALLITHPWMRATPAGADVAGGYLGIVNSGPADRLLGGSLEGARVVEMHDMTTTGGVMTMRPTGPLDIPAGGTLTLAPGGRHLMASGLAHAYVPGTMARGTLVFEHAGTVRVEFAVQAVGARAPAGHDAMPDMPKN